MDELKKFIDSDTEAIAKEAGSKPAPKVDATIKIKNPNKKVEVSAPVKNDDGLGNPIQKGLNDPVAKAKEDYNKGKISMGQLDDVAIKEFENKQKAKANPQPARAKPTYTPFKLDTKKYKDVETTPYGFIYNVGGQSITDLAEQKRAFEGDKFDSSKKYGFSRTTDFGDEVVHESFEDAYNAIKGKSAKPTQAKKPSASVRKLIDLINGEGGSRQGYKMKPNENKIEVGGTNFTMTKEQYNALKEMGYEDEGSGDYSGLHKEAPQSKYREKQQPQVQSEVADEAPKSRFKTTLRKAGDSVKLEDGTEAKVVKYYEDSDDYLVRTADGSTYTYDGYELDRFADPNYNYDEIQDEYEDTASRIVNTPENFGIDKSLIQKIEILQEQGYLDELEKIVTENLQIGDSEEEALENALTNFETNKGQIVDQSQEGVGKDSRIGTTEWFKEQGEKGYGLSEVQTKLGRQLNMSEYNTFIYPKMLNFYDEYKEMGLSDDKIKDEMYDAFGNWDLINKVFDEKTTMSPAESFLRSNDNLNQRIKEERININLLQSKLDNYNNTGDVRAIVDGDVGNFNGLTNGEIMDLLDAFGYDYELKPSKTGKGKTIYYIPRKK